MNNYLKSSAKAIREIIKKTGALIIIFLFAGICYNSYGALVEPAMVNKILCCSTTTNSLYFPHDNNALSAFVTGSCPPDAPTNTIGTTTICLGTSTNLSATLPANADAIYWYSGSCGGTYLGSGNSITVSPTVTTTYYPRSHTTSPACFSTSCGPSVVVTVITSPGIVSVSGGGSFCSGISATLSATGGTNGTIYWQGATSDGTSTDSPSMSQVVSDGNTYYFRAHNVCGWGTAGSGTLTNVSAPENPSPSANFSAICSGGSSTLSAAVADAVIYWYTGSCGGTPLGTGNSIVVSTDTTTFYYAKAYNAATSCWSSGCGSVTVSINSAPEQVSVSGGGTYCAEAALTAGGGTGGTIYWQGTTSNGTSTATPASSKTVSASGTYYFRAWNSCLWGDAGSAEVTIIPHTGAVSVTGGGTICEGSSTTLIASGGTGGTIYWQDATSTGYSFNTPSTSQVVSTTGTYCFVAYNDICGWGEKAYISVTVIPILATPEPTAAQSEICVGGSTTLSASVSGAEIYWYSSSNGGTFIGTGNTKIVSPATTTTYYARANSYNCWSDTASVTVIATPHPPTPTPTAIPSAVCPGIATTTLSASVAGATIYWFTGTCAGTYVGTGNNITGSTGTTYYAKAICGTAAACWSSDCGSVTATVNPQATAPELNVKTPDVSVICAGQGVNATFNAGSGGVGCLDDYIVIIDSGSSVVYTAGTTVGATATNSIVIKGRRAGCIGEVGCNSTDYVTLASWTVIDYPSAITVSGGGTFCGNTTVTASGGAAGTVYWQGTTSGGTNTDSPSTSQAVSESGTYYFRPYNGTCWGDQDSVIVLIQTIPSAVAVSGSGTFCSTALLSASGGTGGTIYWQGTASGGTSTVNATATQNITSSGTYYFRAQSADGCWGLEDSAVVVINPVPSAVAVSGGGIYCDHTIISAAGGTGGTIYWQGTSSNGTSTDMALTSQTVTVSGIYYFRSQSQEGCWGEQDSAVVTVYAIPAAVIVAGGGEQCGGNMLLTASGGISDTIYWQGTTSGGTDMAIPSTSQLVDQSGTYYFRAHVGTCWGAQDSAIVVLYPLPGSITVSGGGAYCGNATLTASGGTGGTIYWQGTSSNGTDMDTPSTVQNVTAQGTYTYYFRSQSVDGCWGEQDSGVVTINALPQANAGADDTVCSGTTTTLQASGGYTYHWSTGDTTASIVVGPSVTATYTVSVTDSLGCAGTDQVKVTVLAPPDADAGFDISIAEGDSASLEANGGILYYWSSDDSTAAITVNPATTTAYTVSVTDVHGCSATDFVNVMVGTSQVPFPTSYWQKNDSIITPIAGVNKVGIGTIHPTEMLTVGGNMDIWGTIKSNSLIGEGYHTDSTSNKSFKLVFVDEKGNFTFQTHAGYPLCEPPYSFAWYLGGNFISSQLNLNNPDWIGTCNKYPFKMYTYGNERMRITEDGNVGIGTINPKHKLEVKGSISLYNPDDDPNFSLFFARGNGANYTETWGVQYVLPNQYTTNLGGLNFWKVYGDNFLLFLADNGNVGISEKAPDHKLCVNGTVKAKEFLCTLDNWHWPDFVFADEYKKMTLNELEKYISLNKHLPGMPSSNEVENNGVNLGEMNAKLLQKIEELTLYIIELNKRNEELEKRIEQIEKPAK